MSCRRLDAGMNGEVNVRHQIDRYVPDARLQHRVASFAAGNKLRDDCSGTGFYVRDRNPIEFNSAAASFGLNRTRRRRNLEAAAAGFHSGAAFDLAAINAAAAGRGLYLPGARSEEHTSELQSHLNLVCRLLLEKKK